MNLIEHAEQHIGHAIQRASAEFALNEAKSRRAGGNPAAADRWALKSLSYSVGVFHRDYQSAAEYLSRKQGPSI